MIDDQDDSSARTAWQRWVRALLVAVVTGGSVAWWAAVQLDSSLTGQPVEFGFWAAFWGTVTAAIGFGVGAWGPAGRAVIMATLTIFAGLFLVWLFAVGAFTT